MTWARIIWAQIAYFFNWLWAWAKGVGWYAKHGRIKDATHALTSPMFALAVAAYVTVAVRWIDAPVPDDPGKWYAKMPMYVQPDSYNFGLKELLPPDEGGHMVRIQINDAQVADVLPDLEDNFDMTDPVDPTYIGRRKRKFKAVIPGPLRRQLESTGFMEATLAEYQSYMENI